MRGIEKGGGLRRIPFKEYTISQLLDEAKKIFFPGGKSGHAKAQKLEFCECSLGNFTGTPLSLQDADSGGHFMKYWGGGRAPRAL